MEELSSPLKFFSELRQKFCRTRVENFLIPIEDFLVCEKILKFCGLPLLGQVEIGRARKFLGLGLVLLLSYAIECFVSLLVHWKDPDKFPAAVENMACFTSTISVLSQACWFLFYIRKPVKEVIEALDENFPHISHQQHNYDVRKYLKELKVISWIAIVAYALAVGQLLVFPIEHHIYCWMTSQHCEMMPVLHHWFPFDVSHPVVYVLIFLWYTVVVSIAVALLFFTDMLYAGLLTILSMEFDILAADMEEGQNETDLRKLIKIHQKLIKIAGKLEKIFAPMLFVHIFLVISGLCSCAFLSVMDLSPPIFIKYCGTFVGYLIDGFILCYYAQKLTDSSSSIVFAAYSTPWYERSLKFRKLLLIVMIIAYEGQKLTAWSFFDVSMETFYWILDASYSYYSVLMGLYDGGH